jgi:hypothetical protein
LHVDIVLVEVGGEVGISGVHVALGIEVGGIGVYGIGDGDVDITGVGRIRVGWGMQALKLKTTRQLMINSFASKPFAVLGINFCKYLSVNCPAKKDRMIGKSLPEN